MERQSVAPSRLARPLARMSTVSHLGQAARLKNILLCKTLG